MIRGRNVGAWCPPGPQSPLSTLSPQNGLPLRALSRYFQAAPHFQKSQSLVQREGAFQHFSTVRKGNFMKRRRQSEPADKSARIVAILEILRKEQTTTMLGEMARSFTPFQLLISAILSARTTDEVTYPLAEELFRHYPTAEKLAAAESGDVERLIRRIGFYKHKARYIIAASRQLLSEHDGMVPAEMEALLRLPGVGRKVAGCVLVYAFGQYAIPVDTHVHRLANRIGLVQTVLPTSTEHELMRITPRMWWKYVNDLFVWHGKTTCKPRVPACYRCLIVDLCEYPDKNLRPFGEG
jgi:endonuclease III